MATNAERNLEYRQILVNRYGLLVPDKVSQPEALILLERNNDIFAVNWCGSPAFLPFQFDFSLGAYSGPNWTPIPAQTGH